MEVPNLTRLFWGWGFPYISRIHTAYIGEDSSILGTNEMFGDKGVTAVFSTSKWSGLGPTLQDHLLQETVSIISCKAITVIVVVRVLREKPIGIWSKSQQKKLAGAAYYYYYY